ncbi:hypothetical protein N1851_013341 [Merluccius polli]|uniref:Uncharacterized protein n=1 Tax=Merluccius polli TaxID=89951 RepID=A0AA47P3R4_MERPO|nr:hypothetical protein N1851_013341 [Merluccius polli]
MSMHWLCSWVVLWRDADDGVYCRDETSNFKITYETTSYKTVILLLFFLLFLVLLVIFLYKKLNKRADGEYTIRNMVLKKGGLRDLLVDWVNTHLGICLWANPDLEEMEVRQGSESVLEEGQEEEEEEEGEEGEEEGEEEVVKVGNAQEGEEGGASDYDDCAASDYDDCAALPSDEQPANQSANLIMEEASCGYVLVHAEKDDEEEEEEERKGGSGKEGDQGSKQGAVLLIDLKFSGGAMWSEEDKNGETVIDLTVL